MATLPEAVVDRRSKGPLAATLLLDELRLPEGSARLVTPANWHFRAELFER
jgi:hypothetical protein